MFSCCVFNPVRNNLNESVMQQNQRLYKQRTSDWKWISAMFRLTWLSGVLFSWEIHTDRYCAEVELISSNCGLCCFTFSVWVQVSLSPPLSVSPLGTPHPPTPKSLGNCSLINIKHTHTYTPVAPWWETAMHKQVSWLPLDCFQFSQSGLSSTESLLWGLSKVCMKSDVLTSVWVWPLNTQGGDK